MDELIARGEGDHHSWNCEPVSECQPFSLNEESRAEY